MRCRFRSVARVVCISLGILSLGCGIVSVSGCKPGSVWTFCPGYAGVHTIIVPKQCMKEVEEIPKELRKKMTFHAVSTMREVLDIAMAEKLSWRSHPVSGPTPSLSQPPAARAGSERGEASE